MRIKTGEIVQIHAEIPIPVDFLKGKVTKGIHQGLGKIVVEITEDYTHRIRKGERYAIWCENVDKM